MESFNSSLYFKSSQGVVVEGVAPGMEMLWVWKKAVQLESRVCVNCISRRFLILTYECTSMLSATRVKFEIKREDLHCPGFVSPVLLAMEILIAL